MKSALALLLVSFAFLPNLAQAKPPVVYTCTATGHTAHGAPYVFKASERALFLAKRKVMDICREEAGNTCVFNSCTHK